MPTFSLAIAGRIKREKPLTNMMQPKAFREFEPEISFFIWCPWRLELDNTVLATSLCSDNEITDGLENLVGKLVTDFEIKPPAWDLTLEFEGRFRLFVFCAIAGRKAVSLTNWQAKLKDIRVYAGPGSQFKITRATG